MRQTPEESWKAFSATGSIKDYLTYRSTLLPEEKEHDQEESEPEREIRPIDTTHYL